MRKRRPQPAGRSMTVLVVTGLLMATTQSGVAVAYSRPGTTERAIPSEGMPHTSLPSISGDGRFIAFNASDDLLEVYDRITKTTERVNDVGYTPMISEDGRYLTFGAIGQASQRAQIFLYDRMTGAREVVSLTPDGSEVPAGVGGFTPAPVRANGRFVVFETRDATIDDIEENAAPWDYDLFVRDRQAGTTERVSVSFTGGEAQRTGPGLLFPLAGADSLYPTITEDGRYVAFASTAGNLVPEDSGAYNDVFVRDMVEGVTERVSVSSDDTESNADSGRVAGHTPTAISADGRFVAFISEASNLVPMDTNEAVDIFVRDRETNVTERVSVSSDGTQANGPSFYPSLSADGRLVTFQSSATNLVSGDVNDVPDVFVHDRLAGTTERVSVAPDGSEADDWSRATVLSRNGRYVAFESKAGNLVDGMPPLNPPIQVYVRDHGPAIGVGDLSATATAGEVTVSGWATFSGDTMATARDTDDVDPAPVGADIAAASVISRAEHEDVLLRLRLDSIPTLVGAPSVVYRWTLKVDGTAYEVRAQHVPGTGAVITIYDCSGAVCTPAGTLPGSIGSTGADVLVAVPHGKVDAQQGSNITGVSVATGPGDAALGPLATYDDLTLPDATVPASEVKLGIVAIETPQEQVDYTTEAALDDGHFTGTLPTEGLPSGDYRLWARACLADSCGTYSTAIRISTQP